MPFLLIAKHCFKTTLQGLKKNFNTNKIHGTLLH